MVASISGNPVYFVMTSTIIGEAMKNIPVAFKEKHPEVSWNNMIELGNVLEHTLSGIDFERVWLVVKNDLPDLKKKIKKILEEMENP